jgi:hypothetical protein
MNEIYLKKYMYIRVIRSETEIEYVPMYVITRKITRVVGDDL